MIKSNDGPQFIGYILAATSILGAFIVGRRAYLVALEYFSAITTKEIDLVFMFSLFLGIASILLTVGFAIAMFTYVSRSIHVLRKDVQSVTGHRELPSK